MANSNQAKKRARQTEKRRIHNSSLRSNVRTFIKKVRKALVDKDLKVALAEFKIAVSKIDKAASKGLLHKNTAARYKSRLSKQIKELSSGSSKAA